MTKNIHGRGNDRLLQGLTTTTSAQVHEGAIFRHNSHIARDERDDVVFSRQAHGNGESCGRLASQQRRYAAGGADTAAERCKGSRCGTYLEESLLREMYTSILSARVLYPISRFIRLQIARKGENVKGRTGTVAVHRDQAQITAKETRILLVSTDTSTPVERLRRLGSSLASPD